LEPGGTISLVFDGHALDLTSLDGVDLLPGGAVAFSTATTQFIGTGTGVQQLHHQNAYILDGTGGAMLVLDGVSHQLTSLDAFSLARGLEIEP
jgi:hypothetical protein